MESYWLVLDTDAHTHTNGGSQQWSPTNSIDEFLEQVKADGGKFSLFDDFGEGNIIVFNILKNLTVLFDCCEAESH